MQDLVQYEATGKKPLVPCGQNLVNLKKRPAAAKIIPHNPCDGCLYGVCPENTARILTNQPMVEVMA